MKKLIILVTVVAFGLGLSSCYHHHTCATYTKADKQIQKVSAEEAVENI